MSLNLFISRFFTGVHWFFNLRSGRAVIYWPIFEYSMEYIRLFLWGDVNQEVHMYVWTMVNCVCSNVDFGSAPVGIYLRKHPIRIFRIHLTPSPQPHLLCIFVLWICICIRTKFSVRNLYVIRMTLIEGSRVRSRLLGLVHMMHDNIVFVDSKDCRVGDWSRPQRHHQEHIQFMQWVKLLDGEDT